MTALGSCPVTGAWAGWFIRCDLPAGHQTLGEHLDAGRCLRWGLDGDGTVRAWAGTRAEHEAWVARVEACLAEHAGWRKAS